MVQAEVGNTIKWAVSERNLSAKGEHKQVLLEHLTSLTVRDTAFGNIEVRVFSIADADVVVLC